MSLRINLKWNRQAVAYLMEGISEIGSGLVVSRQEIISS